jgi:hypothetical protein
VNGTGVLPEQEITRVTDERRECQKLAVCCGIWISITMDALTTLLTPVTLMAFGMASILPLEDSHRNPDYIRR